MSATAIDAEAAVPRRIPARELLTAEQLASVRERVEWKSLALVGLALGPAIGVFAMLRLVEGS
jgi:hypothetical protein